MSPKKLNSAATLRAVNRSILPKDAKTPTAATITKEPAKEKKAIAT